MTAAPRSVMIVTMTTQNCCLKVPFKGPVTQKCPHTVINSKLLLGNVVTRQENNIKCECNMRHSLNVKNTDSVAAQLHIHGEVVIVCLIKHFQIGKQKKINNKNLIHGAICCLAASSFYFFNLP